MGGDGDGDFARRFEGLRLRLASYAAAVTGDAGLAEDVVQEVAVRLLKKERGGERIDNWKALAFSIARNVAVDLIRKDARRREAVSELALERLTEAAVEEDGLRVEMRVLRECLEKLPEKWRRMVTLRFWDGLRVDAVAERVGTTANVVSVTLHRACKRLAECVRRKAAF